MSIEVDNIKIGDKTAIVGAVKLPFLKGDTGKQGIQGVQGQPGVSVKSVTQIVIDEEENGVNIIEVALDNNTKTTFQVKNGNSPYISSGYWYIGGENTGVRAIAQDGKDGTNGTDGLTPYIKNDYWYIGNENTGVKATGQTGKDGADGKDYIITDADKEEIANSVRSDLSKDYVSQNDFNEAIGDITSVLDSINGEVI